MKVSRLPVGVIFAVTLVCAATMLPQIASAETAKEAYDRGTELLGDGDFQKALQAYSVAARADKSNQQYTQQFMLLRRVIALQNNLKKEKNPQRWQNTARALRSFYVSQGMYPQALSIDQQKHEKSNTAASASQLAETLLAMNKTADAEKVLAGLDTEKSTPSTQALLSIAIARQERVDEARKISQKVSPPNKAGPLTHYTLARMHAMVGAEDKALASLTSCLQTVAPSSAEGFKAHARQTPEFATLATTARFAEVLETKSKVSESKCSGGTSCAGCPSRGNCSKDEKK
jgi:thioredoxin-like negative regulator of GroEL